MESDNFLEWFNNMFRPAVDHLLRTRAVVLLLDGHHSHLSLSLIRTAKELFTVTVFLLTPHTSSTL